MNIKKKVLSLVACVAVIVVLSGCTAADAARSPEMPSSAPQQQKTVPAMPEEYDELVNWSSGETIPEMVAVGTMMGLGDIYIPNVDFVDMGYVGIAPLETHCVVAFHGTMEEAQRTGRLSVDVMSRFNLDFDVVLPNATLDEIKAFIDEMRPSCVDPTSMPA